MRGAGQSDECSKWIHEILERDPNQLSGLRLLIRYNSWLKDENGFRLALERLYTAASAQGSVEDERFALSQLIVIRPHETRYRDRLAEINSEYGFEDSPVDEELLRAQFETEKPADVDIKQNGHKPDADIPDLERFESDDDEVINAEIIEPSDGNGNKSKKKEKLSHADEEKIQKELESIAFYIENDYNDLAEKALKELVAEFGDRQEFADCRNRIGAVIDEAEPQGKAEPQAAAQQEVVAEEIVEGVVAEVAGEVVANTLGINEIRSEFGIEGADESDNSDYETHYHMGVAYQEMCLTEDAIREFQDAIALVDPKDGTRRFYQCANLLGHCFMQNGMPNHAITWLTRALDTTGISDEEHHGLWYELAAAHEANGDEDQAADLFERIYAENVNFRDVRNRVKHLVTK